MMHSGPCRHSIRIHAAGLGTHLTGHGHWVSHCAHTAHHTHRAHGSHVGGVHVTVVATRSVEARWKVWVGKVTAQIVVIVSFCENKENKEKGRRGSQTGSFRC